MGFTLCPTLTVSWSSQARGGRWSRRRYPLRPPPLQATGIKLHYIRLLAGIRLVLSITAPANNPTGRRGQTHRRPGSPRPFFSPASRRLLIQSFIHSSLARRHPFSARLLSFSSCSCASSGWRSPPPLPVFLFREREKNPDCRPSPTTSPAPGLRLLGTHAPALPESRPGRDYNPLSCTATAVAHSRGRQRQNSRTPCTVRAAQSRSRTKHVKTHQSSKVRRRSAKRRCVVECVGIGDIVTLCVPLSIDAIVQQRQNAFWPFCGTLIHFSNTGGFPAHFAILYPGEMKIIL